MKRNKLYKVNRFNYPVVTSEGNLYSVGGFLKGIGDKVGNFMGGSEIAGSPIGGLAGVASNAVGKLLSGGRSSTAGNIISGIGGAVSTANPILGAGITLAGHALNFAIGTKVDQEKLNAAMSGTDALRNYTSTASSFDDIQGPEAMAKVENPYSGGIGGSSERKNNELRRQRADALAWAERGIDNNINNLSKSQADSAAANYSAFGGAIDYGFMQDYLTNKKREAEYRNKIGSLTQIPSFMPQNTLALGGDLQTHGGDFSDGLTIINAGLSHEENPNEGVQLGVDSQNVPNLVEEGETIYNQYVFSNRILADDATKQMFRLHRKKDYTFADISKRLEKEISERTNDPISKRGFEKQMQMLEEQQERQKQEMEAARAKAAFDALSPEEQVAVIQQLQQEEQMAQQAAMQEEAAIQQPTPEEMAMAEQQQMMQADGSQAALGQEPQMNAEGGKINKFEKGGKKNVGTWKNEEEDHWGIFTRPGLKRYIEELRARLNMAPDEDTKNAIRREAMNELNSLQQSYFSHVLPTAGADRYDYNEDILKHQQLFDRLYGNTGFYSTDDNGNVKNLIAEAINLPNGAATDDKPENWADGYNGRRTSIRNFGSTEYGDDAYYKDLVDDFAGLGLTYAPNENWKYGDNRLYALSIPEGGSQEEDKSKIWDWKTAAWTSPEPAPTDKADTPASQETVAPRHKKDWMRYAGLFGPAVGLGLQMAGVGRPDTRTLDAAISRSGDVDIADYHPIGNYLTYRPLDIWYAQNAMNAQARATDRNLMNTSGGNRGTASAGILANGYNSQIASGNLFRQAQEYNDALRQRVEDFNRGTDMFNAEAYNKTSQFNADARNRARQADAHLRLQAAAQKMGADAGWANGIYGNISGLFKGLSDLGRENAQFNWLSDLAADGAFGNLGKSNTGKQWIKKTKSKGGKIRKKGLTI